MRHRWQTCRLRWEHGGLLRVQGGGVRRIARQLGRAASTVSWELRRNADTRSGDLEYRATTAQWHADRSARRPKSAKLVVNSVLRDYVQERLVGNVGCGERQSHSGAGRDLESSPSRTSAGPAVGQGVESRTDLASPAA